MICSTWLTILALIGSDHKPWLCTKSQDETDCLSSPSSPPHMQNSIANDNHGACLKMLADMRFDTDRVFNETIHHVQLTPQGELRYNHRRGIDHPCHDVFKHHFHAVSLPWGDSSNLSHRKLLEVASSLGALLVIENADAIEDAEKATEEEAEKVIEEAEKAREEAEKARKE